MRHLPLPHFPMTVNNHTFTELINKKGFVEVFFNTLAWRWWSLSVVGKGPNVAYSNSIFTVFLTVVTFVLIINNMTSLLQCTFRVILLWDDGSRRMAAPMRTTPFPHYLFSKPLSRQRLTLPMIAVNSDSCVENPRFLLG